MSEKEEKEKRPKGRPPRGESVRRLEVHLPQHLGDILEQIAKERGTSMKSLIVQALSEKFLKPLDAKRVTDLMENYLRPEARKHAIGTVPTCDLCRRYHYWQKVKNGEIQVSQETKDQAQSQLDDLSFMHAQIHLTYVD